jgi:hypothetical protein
MTKGSAKTHITPFAQKIWDDSRSRKEVTMNEQPLASQNTLPTQETVSAPTYKLYTPWQVFGATFLGGPIAGAWLIGSNYAALGYPEDRNKALLWGSVATVILLVLALFILPEQTPRSLIPVASCVGLMFLAKSQQGSLVEAHLAKGGNKGSIWQVIGIGLLGLVITLAIGFALAFLVPA